MPTCLDAGAAKAVHEIPHREPFANGLRRVFVAARIDHRDTVGHEEGGERDVRRHGNVARDRAHGDVPVRDIRSAVHAHGRRVRIAGQHLDALVGDENGLEAKAVRGLEADRFHVSRNGVRVDTEFHRMSGVESVVGAQCMGETYKWPTPAHAGMFDFRRPERGLVGHS